MKTSKFSISGLKNHLTFNRSKCVEMLIGEYNHGCSDKLVSNRKNLGVCIDVKLNSIPHIQTLLKKQNQFCEGAYQARHLSPENKWPNFMMHT